MVVMALTHVTPSLGHVSTAEVSVCYLDFVIFSNYSVDIGWVGQGVFKGKGFRASPRRTPKCTTAENSERLGADCVLEVVLPCDTASDIGSIVHAAHL